ncbi:DUF2332 domain-containing protein [Methylosinus sp. Sm6]|uniref:DUF2332 domain-containing protein n=1 Tax=Methylosinus sp. Sm6 TaxID=2866948 RepID=UPI001C997A2D|nr:DUF2332 family protein [Methylosinus sp. Sm6]MBY6240904.1 DUF2332 family protein [Methylosinus sp. Sm6]
METPSSRAAAPGERAPVDACFATQAEACRHLGSPFTAALCEMLRADLDTRSAFGRRILSWGRRATADALALRAAGALHFLARSKRAPELAAAYPPQDVGEAALRRALAAAIGEHDEFLAGFLDRPPQTNEAARSSILLGGALYVASVVKRPLEILEIGASAGLNLHFDRYSHDLGVGRWGPPDAGLRLVCDWRGAPPPLCAPLEIAARSGCDVDPLDPGLPADRERLLAYVWPDQAERLARMETALALAARREERVERADAGDFLAARLAAPLAPGRARLLHHSIVWQYLPLETKTRAKALIEAAGAAATRAAPFAWARMEADGDMRSAAVTLTLWPSGESVALGRADFHGRWAQWNAKAPVPIS